MTSEAQLLDLYDRTFETVYRCAARLTRGDRASAEDLVQDAFVRLVRAIRNGTVEDVGVGWLVTTVRRRFVDRLRSTERERVRLRLVAVDSVAIEATDATTGAESSLLDDLTERERAALILRYVDNLPVADVADLLDSSVRATESLLQRAKRKARGSENAS